MGTYGGHDKLIADAKEALEANIGVSECGWEAFYASRIEALLIDALYLRVKIDPPMHERGLSRNKQEPGYVPVFEQQMICDCRVDFFIPAPNGEGLVIECDGHDFHERTKRQAKRDRSRDRAFQQAGYTVFRFTGSEIYNDAWECAGQIFDWYRARLLRTDGGGK